jgi:hypothetical protein
MFKIPFACSRQQAYLIDYQRIPLVVHWSNSILIY